jgi:transposase-like protein
VLASRGKRVIEIEQELGIRPGLLYKWQGRYREVEPRDNGSTKPSIRELEAEIRRLKGENAVLQAEREILKKKKCPKCQTGTNQHCIEES